MATLEASSSTLSFKQAELFACLASQTFATSGQPADPDHNGLSSLILHQEDQEDSPDVSEEEGVTSDLDCPKEDEANLSVFFCDPDNLSRYELEIASKSIFLLFKASPPPSATEVKFVDQC